MTSLVRCGPADPGFAQALAAGGLPPSALDVACFALTDGGYGALEGTGPDRLLRSVVVPEHLRGSGAGTALVAALVEEARRSGAERLWLLTTNAVDFFARLGWTVADRATAPVPINTSDQFTTLCPASAVLMVREIG